MRAADAIPGGADRQAAHSNSTWGLLATGVTSSPYSGAGVTLGFVGTAVDTSNEAFTGVEFVSRDFAKDTEDADLVEYGTHCVATMCGRPVNGQRIGVAPSVKRVVVASALGREGGGIEQVFDATLWAVREGAQVVLVSLSVDFPGVLKVAVERGVPLEIAAAQAFETFRHTLRLFNALAAVCTGGARPSLLVGAVGNESQRDMSKQHVIGACLPAAADGFFAVGALTQSKEHAGRFDVAPFSNSGAHVAAPGVDVLSAVPGGMRSMSGTSMAASHAAGIAALWVQKLQEAGGPVDLGLLTARIRGQANTKTLVPGLGVDEVGSGLIQAPQD